MLKEFKVNITYLVSVIAVIFFVSGFGWGQWFAEMSIRNERSQLEKGRLSVSMPMDEDEAIAVFETLSILVAKARKERHE